VRAAVRSVGADRRGARAVLALPHPLHLFEFLTRSGHYHVGLAPAEAEPLSRAMDRLISACLGRLARGSRVLDVGSGLGGTVALLEKAGFRAVGIDPDWRAVAYAAARSPAGAEHRLGTLEDVSDGPFDAVLLTEVLQHHRDLMPLLARSFALLSPGGFLLVHDPVLLVDVPWERVPYHRSGALAECAARAGFEVCERRDLSAEIRPTFALLGELFEARRAELLSAFAGRAGVEAQLDELAQHVQVLERGFADGYLAYERTWLRVPPAA